MGQGESGEPNKIPTELGNPAGIDSEAPQIAPPDRESVRRKLHHQQRRGLLLTATAVGLLTGTLSVAYRGAVTFAESSSHTLAQKLYGFGIVGIAAIASLGAVLGGLSGWLTETYAPEAAGSGIPHIKAALMNLRVIRPIRILAVKFTAGWLALAAGMSLGREGPTIQMGSAVGQLIARMAKIPKRSHHLMVAAGAGAGLAGAFNAPLAGFVFVMEELKLAMTPVTYGVALFATVTSVAVTRMALGQVPSFMVKNPSPVPLTALWVVVVLGVVCGLVGIAYNRMLIGFLNLRGRLKLTRWLAGAIVGAVLATAILWAQGVTGGGHEITQQILSGGFSHVALGYCLFLLVGKIFSTTASYGTGVPGGIFAPILVIGSLTGFLIGSVANDAFPTLGISPEVFATIGMAAVLASSVQAPLTGVVLIFEMSGEYNLLYALLLGSFLAYGVADLLHERPIYERLLERDLHGGEQHEPIDGPLEIELTVDPNSTMDGRRLRGLSLPESALVVGISRDGKRMVPKGDTRIQGGDTLLIHIDGENAEVAAVSLQDAARAP